MLLRNHSVAITGRLTCDPKLRPGSPGKSVCELTVAVDRLPGDALAAASVASADCIDVMISGGDRENAAALLEMGSAVTIRGHAEHREWRAPDGSTRQTIRIVADDVQRAGTQLRTDRDGAPVHPHPRTADDPVARPEAESETLTTFTRLADIPFDR